MMVEVLHSAVSTLIGFAIGLGILFLWDWIQERKTLTFKLRSPKRKLPKEIRRVSPYALYDGYIIWVAETGSVWIWEHGVWKNTYTNEVYFSDLLGRPQRVGKP